MYFTLIKSGSISLLLTICFALSCFGQVAQLDRYELALEGQAGFGYPEVTSLGQEGILIHRRIPDKKNDQLELIKIDTSLTENWRGAITVDKNLDVSRVVAHDQLVYIFFRSVVYGSFDFNVIAVNVRTRNYESYLVKNVIPLSPTDFKITNNAILIAGYFVNSPIVLHFSLSTGLSRLLPGFFTEPGQINQIKTYDDGLIDIIVSMRNLQRKHVLWMRSYTAEGDLIHATLLEDDNEKNLTFGNSIRKPDGTQVIAGSFGARNVEYSRGVFFAELDASGGHTIQYHKFSDSENFFKYLKPRREVRLKERIERRKLKGKKNRQAFRFLTHELYQYGDEYLLLGESFYPRYLYLNNFSYSMRGDRIFDGYRYTHASVFAFDDRGTLKWDNTLEMNDVKSFTLRQFVKLSPTDEKMGMLYLDENTLRSKTIYRNQVLEGKSTNELKSDKGIIKERKTEASRLEYWYSPYFFARGIQYVRNSGKDELGRRVLFINKLKFQ
jgi:hypothetical protein